jgi:hypothetical protein
MRQVVADRRDPIGASAAQIAVVSHHPAELRRIALIEHQLQLFLPAVHVCNCQLAREGLSLASDPLLCLRPFRSESRQAGFGRDPARANGGQPLPGRLDLQVGVLDLPGKRVAPFGILLNRPANGLDPALNLLELGFLGIGSRRRGLKSRGAQQQCASEPNDARDPGDADTPGNPPGNP